MPWIRFHLVYFYARLCAHLWCGLKCQETHSLRRSVKNIRMTRTNFTKFPIEQFSASIFFHLFLWPNTPFDLYANDSFGQFWSQRLFFSSSPACPLFRSLKFISTSINFMAFGYFEWIKNISRFLFILCANLSKNIHIGCVLSFVFFSFHND